MNNLRLNTIWVLAKRELRSTIYGAGIYLVITVSLVISAVKLTAGILDGLPWASLASWLRLLIEQQPPKAAIR